MICAYCKNDTKLTREHLIPMSLIDLFPECDINYMQDRVFKSENLVIKDVCSNCNNKTLSELDAYGASMVKDYFVKEYEPSDFLALPYDYLLLSKWLLKILYNFARSNKDDVAWFEQNMDYVLGKTDETILPFSIFSGLAVNTAPIPEFFFQNIKLGVDFNPTILQDSMLEIVDLENRSVRIRENQQPVVFPKLNKSAILRFGSVIFLVFLWDEEIDSQEKDENEKTMLSTYPYSILNPNSEMAVLNRVTHAFNYYNYNIVDTTPGMYIADQTNSFLPYHVNPIEQRKKDSEKWDEHVNGVRESRAARRMREKEQRRKNRGKKK